MTLRVRRLLTGFAMLAATVCTYAADLTLRYKHPAPDTHEGWEREALPIGNGRIGAMIFGQLARERIQFNDISLWTGDEKVMGAYQPFGDVFIALPGHDADVTSYNRELDLAAGLQRVSYQKDGVT
jgi:alpha-L-fucosidase 2